MKESATIPQAFDPNSPLAPSERQVDDVDGPMRIKMNPDLTITANMGARGTIIEKVDRQNMTFEIKSSGVTMNGFADLLSTILMQVGGANSRQVVDMTGLTGRYDFTLEYSVDELRTLVRASGGDASHIPDFGGDPTVSIFTSVESLGLKLEPRKAPVDVIVIDSVQKTPTAN